MTNEEVISRLRALHLVSEDYSDKEAIRIAIKALKQPEIIRCKDCINYAISRAKRPWCQSSTRRTEPDGFCSKGQRRDKENS